MDKENSKVKHTIDNDDNTLASVSRWATPSEIELKKGIIYLLRRPELMFKCGKEQVMYEYFIGRYAGKLQTKWHGKKDALYVNGERQPQEPEKYEFVVLDDSQTCD